MKLKNNNKKLISHEELLQQLYPTKAERDEFDRKYKEWSKKIDLEVQAEVASKIRKERKEVGLTQEQLAQKIKTSRNNVVAIESGTRNVTIETLDRIAEALGKELVIMFK